MHYCQDCALVPQRYSTIPSGFCLGIVGRIGLRAPWCAGCTCAPAARQGLFVVDFVFSRTRYASSIASTRLIMSNELTRDTFAQQLNTQFNLESSGGTVALELVEASAVRLSGGFKSFSIVFRGPADVFLPQAIYPFHHDAIGAFDLFIVPIRQDAQGFYYEVVFNRMRQEPQV